MWTERLSRILAFVEDTRCRLSENANQKCVDAAPQPSASQKEHDEQIDWQRRKILRDAGHQAWVQQVEDRDDWERITGLEEFDSP